jgi:hypothetical protein
MMSSLLTCVVLFSCCFLCAVVVLGRAVTDLRVWLSVWGDIGKCERKVRECSDAPERCAHVRQHGWERQLTLSWHKVRDVEATPRQGQKL